MIQEGQAFELAPLQTFLGAAWRRYVSNLILEEAARALTVAFAAFSIWVVIGNDALAWQWLLAGSVVTAAIFAWRTWRRHLPLDRYSRRLDLDLGWNDALATAVAIGGDAGRWDESIVVSQRRDALALVRSMPPAAAVPVRAPRGWRLLLAATAVCASLFVVRYAKQQSLALGAPLIQLWDQNLPFARRPAEQARKRDEKLPDWMRDLGFSLDDTGLTDVPPEPAQRPQPQATAGESSVPPEFEDQLRGFSLDQDGNSEPFNAKSANSNQKGESRGRDQSDSGGESPGEEGGDEGSDKNPSLLDRFRNAVAGMVSKAKEAAQSARGEKGNSGGDKAEMASQKGPQGQQAQSSPGSSAPQNAGGEQGQPSEDAQAAQGDGGKTSESSGQSPSEGAQSGMGKQDGAKEAREAAQLEAMGKISEILGQRAQNVTGEVMLEVQSGRQQLRTPYSQREATHGAAGGEVHRDEIPLLYRNYVQQYFSKLRNQGVAKPQPGSDKQDRQSGARSSQ